MRTVGPVGVGLRGLLAVVLALLGAVAVASPAAADRVRDDQWQLGFLRAEDAWRYSAGAGVTVAVVDSGVDATHPDLIGQVLPGRDFVTGTGDGRKDPVGHGTTVAGLIAGRGDDADGVEGLAYRAKILPVRVLDERNRYDSADTVAQGVRWAVDNGAKVINLSLGSADTAPVLAEALRYAFSKDVVVVACDGNVANGRGYRVWHPAREPGVLAVSGVLRSGAFWPGSLQGSETTLSAPAAEIMGATPGRRYEDVQGTSFASPLVAASAALVRARFPKMSAPNVVNRLIRTAWDSGPVGRDPRFGFGIVNPARALTADVPSVTTNPLLDTASATGAPTAAPSGGPDRPGEPRGVDAPTGAPVRADGPPLAALVLGGGALVAALMLVVLLIVGAVLLRWRPAPVGPAAAGRPAPWPPPGGYPPGPPGGPYRPPPAEPLPPPVRSPGDGPGSAYRPPGPPLP